MRIGDAGHTGVKQRHHDVVGVKPGIRGKAVDRVAIGKVGTGIEIAHIGKDIELYPTKQRGKAIGGACRTSDRLLEPVWVMSLPGPCSSKISLILSAISVPISSQLMRFHLPSPRSPTRFRG